METPCLEGVSTPARGCTCGRRMQTQVGCKALGKPPGQQDRWGGARLVRAQAHPQRAPPARLGRHEAAVHAAVEPGIVAGGEVGHNCRERRRVHAALPAPRAARSSRTARAASASASGHKGSLPRARHCRRLALRPGASAAALRSRGCQPGPARVPALLGDRARELWRPPPSWRAPCLIAPRPPPCPCREARRARATSGHAGAPHQSTYVPVRAPVHAHAPRSRRGAWQSRCRPLPA